VNLIFLFEGEEESGSENLDRFLRANAKRLACDAVVVSDSSMYAPGIPALTYGLRGLAYLEVTVRGANRDLHSGVFGGAAPNPANALAGMLARLHDGAGRVDVPGFYDEVRPLEEWERGMWAALGHDEAALTADLGASALPGESGFTALERMWARPTLDVNGLTAGYQGEGAKTVIPATASAKFSCRLVPDQEPGRVADLLERRLRELLPPGFSLEVKRLHGARPVLLPTTGWAAESAREASSAAWGREPVLIREGGSIPVVDTFASLFDAPVVLLGLGRPDDRAHGPDERYHIEDFQKGIEISARLWGELGDRFEIKR
jgi:amidohydrolase